MRKGSATNIEIKMAEPSENGSSSQGKGPDDLISRKEFDEAKVAHIEEQSKQIEVLETSIKEWAKRSFDHLQHNLNILGDRESKLSLEIDAAIDNLKQRLESMEKLTGRAGDDQLEFQLRELEKISGGDEQTSQQQYSVRGIREFMVARDRVIKGLKTRLEVEREERKNADALQREKEDELEAVKWELGVLKQEKDKWEKCLEDEKDTVEELQSKLDDCYADMKRFFDAKGRSGDRRP
ncbi:hypothetical protein NHQ30_010857 [Ciborinia camelliae]|nr:hypothetical protein NHQ30_010857 [Ciborinia camelliae]